MSTGVMQVWGGAIFLSLHPMLTVTSYSTASPCVDSGASVDSSGSAVAPQSPLCCPCESSHLTSPLWVVTPVSHRACVTFASYHPCVNPMSHRACVTLRVVIPLSPLSVIAPVGCCPYDSSCPCRLFWLSPICYPPSTVFGAEELCTRGYWVIILCPHFPNAAHPSTPSLV